MIRVNAPDGNVINFPETMTEEEILSVMREKFPPVQVDQQTPRGRGFQDYAQEGIRTLGRAGRNIVGGATSLVDVGLLFPKTIASGAEVAMESAGMEGSSAEQFAQKIRTLPTLRDQALQGVDYLTGDALKPRNTMESVTDFVSEMTVPSGVFGKVTQLQKIQKAPKSIDALKMALNPEMAAQQKFATQAMNAVPDFSAQQERSIRLSRGQRTGDFDAQEFEDLARKGVLGDSAREVAENFDLQQQTDVLQALGAGPRTLQTARGIYDATEEAASIAQAGRDRLKTYVNRAYQKARNLKDGVGFDVGEVKRGLVQGIEESLDADGLKPNKNIMPIADSVFNTLKKQTNAKNVKSLKIGALEDWRKMASQQANSRALAGTPEGLSLQRIVRVYDNFMEELADAAINEGDVAAINAFRKARGLRARLGKIYESNKIVNEITSGQVPTVEAMTHKIFGSANFDSKKDAAQTVRALRKAARGRAKEFDAVIQEGVLSKLLENSKSDRILPGTDIKSVSLSKLETQLDRILLRNRSLAKEVFGNEKFKELENLYFDLGKIKSQQPGTVNHSNSANRILRAVGSVGNMSRYFPLVEATKTILVDPVKDLRSASKAKKVFSDPSAILGEITEKSRGLTRNEAIGSALFGATAISAGIQE